LPPLPEQRAIAAVLSSFDDKIELLREQNKILETTAQTIFKEWFVKFNFPGATEKMIDSELGKIPEGWRVGGLIEDGISEFVKTNIDEFEGVKDYIETANVNLSSLVGSFEKITYFKRPSRANMQPVPNSFWFARMAESRKYLLFQEKDKQDIETKILSTGFAGIKCIKEYLYFYWCFILSDMFNNLKNQYADGAVQVAISNDGIKKIMFVLPPKNLAEKFTKTVEACFEKISNNISQIQTLSNLRDTLLPKLMEGEVRVKGFNN
jgi:type I restriction enzyme S subunit